MNADIRSDGNAADGALYSRQGFGARLSVEAPIGLAIIDFVNGFADPDSFGGGNIGAAIERTVPLLAHARAQGWPIAHTRIVFADDASDANIFSRKVPSLLGLTEASSSSQIVSQLRPLPGELVVRKTLPSGFAGTALQAWFSSRGVKTVVFAGTTTSGCVRASVLDAVNAGFLPFVVRDCVGDRALGPHEANLFDMQQKYAEVIDLDDLFAILESGGAA